MVGKDLFDSGLITVRIRRLAGRRRLFDRYL